MDDNEHQKQLWKKIQSARKFWTSDKSKTSTDNMRIKQQGNPIQILGSANNHLFKSGRGRSYKKFRSRHYLRDTADMRKPNEDIASQASDKSRKDIYDWLSNIQTGSDGNEMSITKSQELTADPDKAASTSMEPYVSSTGQQQTVGSKITKARRTRQVPTATVITRCDGQSGNKTCSNSGVTRFEYGNSSSTLHTQQMSNNDANSQALGQEAIPVIKSRRQVSVQQQVPPTQITCAPGVDRMRGEPSEVFSFHY